MVVRARIPGTQEAEVGESPEFQASLDDTGKPCHKRKQNTNIAPTKQKSVPTKNTAGELESSVRTSVQDQISDPQNPRKKLGTEAHVPDQCLGGRDRRFP